MFSVILRLFISIQAVKSLIKFKKIFLERPFVHYFSELEQVIARSVVFAAC